MAPFLRDRYGLTLGETGALISASLAGSVLSLVPWGIVTDRIGERMVLVTGVGACGGALLAASRVGSFLPLFLLLMLAGFAGASVQAASGRAVVAWFPAHRRGVALAIRQTAIPISGFVASLGLPPLVRHGGTGLGFATLGIACLVAALAGGLLLRERPVPAAADDDRSVAPLRDRRLWRVSIGSALVLAPQNCVLGFAVLFLHDHRGLSPGAAAAVLAVVQALGVPGRIAAGRWSDAVGSRLRPLRAIALVVAVLVVLTATLVDAPLIVLLPALVAAGVLAMSWNSLSFAAAVELAGYRRSGAAIGLQQSILNGSGTFYPPLFGLLVAATSWRWGFLALALFPLAGRQVLRALPG